MFKQMTDVLQFQYSQIMFIARHEGIGRGRSGGRVTVIKARRDRLNLEIGAKE